MLNMIGLRVGLLLAAGLLPMMACRLCADPGRELTRDELEQAEAARVKSGGPTVRLPPFLVTGSIHQEWQYAELPGFEILSTCSKSDTEEFVREVWWQQESLSEIVPTNLQARDTVPVSLILFNEQNQRSMSQGVATLARKQAAEAARAMAEAGIQSLTVQETELIPQLKLWDEDSTGVDIILSHRAGGRYRNISFAPDYIYFLLARRAPPVPPWFIEGVLNFYQIQQLERIAAADPTRVTERVSTVFGTFEGEVVVQPANTMERVPPVPPLVWITPTVSALLKAHPDFLSLMPLQELLGSRSPAAGDEPGKRAWFSRVGHGIHISATPDVAWGPLIPMRELVDDYPANGSSPEVKQAWLSRFWLSAQAQMILRKGAERDSPWRREVWRSQIMLFLRWVYDDGGGARRKALWKFVDRSGTEPVTEGLFRECFGLGYEEAQGRMLEYLPRALNKGFDLAPGASVDAPTIRLREATDGERGRIIGDWQRKETEFVRASARDYAEEYGEQAEHTLMDAYDSGSREPGLLAALGLYEYMDGDAVQERAFLEEAVRTGAVRPRAYVELARLRYAEAIRKPGGRGGRLDPAQVEAVMALLQSIRAQLPPQLSGYELAAAALEHAEGPPSAADLGMLREGLGFFPGDPALVRAVEDLAKRPGR